MLSMATRRRSLKAALFDLDETLLADKTGAMEAARRVCAALAPDLPHTEPSAVFDAYNRVSDTVWTALGDVPQMSDATASGGQAIRSHVWEQVLTQVGSTDGPLAQAAARLYALERRNTYVLFPDVEDALRQLQSRYRIGIVTNGAAGTQQEKIAVTGLDRYADVVKVSGELGYGKPDPRIFLDALAALGIRPEQAVHVGDSLRSDVAGAKAAGIMAVWVNRDGRRPEDVRVEPDAEVQGLGVLLSVLGPE